MDEYRNVLLEALGRLTIGDDLEDWVIWLMVKTARWPEGVVDFTEINNAHNTNSRVATAKALVDMIKGLKK